MKLFLLRHGRADWPEWTGADDERPLTDEGIQEMERVGAALDRAKVRPDRILSSPLARTLRTAEIAGRALNAPVETRVELEPGFTRRQCEALLASRLGEDLMLVGHEPDLSRLVLSMTGGRVKFSKAAAAAIEIGEELAGPRLVWLFPARMLIRLYE